MLDKNRTGYASLPAELIFEALKSVDQVTGTVNDLLKIDENVIQSLRDQLLRKGLIGDIGNDTRKKVEIMAVDGACINDRLSAADLILAVAVGVEGIKTDNPQSWRGQNQYHSWSSVLPHEEYNSRLAQGIMHIMEMMILAQSDYDIMIMDGSFLTPIIKMNSLLSVNEAGIEGTNRQYCQELKKFLNDRFGKDIYELPHILGKVLADETDKVVGVVKYSSSRDFLSGVVNFKQHTNLDDKSFFSIALGVNEYTKPLPVGQSPLERDQRWGLLHVRCNLNDQESTDWGRLNDRFEDALYSVTTKDKKQSKIYFLYFKPVARVAYRLEIKEKLALDKDRLEEVLYNLKLQIASPFMIEPIPQFIADKMSKHIKPIAESLKTAMLGSSKLNLQKEYLHLFGSPYRS